MGGTTEQLFSAQGRDGGDAQKSGTCCWCKRFLSAAELPVTKRIFFLVGCCKERFILS